MLDPRPLLTEFARLSPTPPRLFVAPGRVNLIGEHTDYNDGFVLPLAIDRATITAAAARTDRLVRVRSQARDETLEFSLDGPVVSRPGQWLAYVEGMARGLLAGGVPVDGADLLIASDVPAGAGLSSSAALELSVGLALASLAGTALDPTRLALLGQAAEHHFAGTRCGIMDQLVVALGQTDQALLIDCRSLATTAVPLALPGRLLVLCDTRVKHQLAAGEYNRRRAECEQGVALLQTVLPGVRALRDVSPEQLHDHEALLPEPVRRRCRHVVRENARTEAAARALAAGDLAALGALMFESHRSLRDDYEVSCAELDALVDAAAALPGVEGSRMTGGGFGGCTVSVVRAERLDEFRAGVDEALRRLTGRAPQLFVTRACRGAHELEI